MVAIVLGVGLGLGLWALLVGARPPAPSVASVLARLNGKIAALEPTSSMPDTASGWSTRAGRRAVPLLARAGLPMAKTRRDLAILDRAAEDLLAQQAATGATALLLGPLADLWFSAIGVHAPGVLLLGGTLIGAGVMFWMPVLIAAEAAKTARAEISAALAMFLELAGASLAAGSGVEQALTDAAAIGEGPTFVKLRTALAAAHLARTSFPAVFGRLADDLDSADLRQMAAAVSLTGSEGARIKDALAAKAAVLRSRRLAEVQASAETATERCGLPIAVMFLGFLIAIGFPALAKVLAGLG